MVFFRCPSAFSSLFSVHLDHLHIRCLKSVLLALFFKKMFKLYLRCVLLYTFLFIYFLCFWFNGFCLYIYIMYLFVHYITIVYLFICMYLIYLGKMYFNLIGKKRGKKLKHTSNKIIIKLIQIITCSCETRNKLKRFPRP